MKLPFDIKLPGIRGKEWGHACNAAGVEGCILPAISRTTTQPSPPAITTLASDDTIKTSLDLGQCLSCDGSEYYIE